jgi:hypothetical protein
MGSIEEARRAGTKAAKAAVKINNTVAARKERQRQPRPLTPLAIGETQAPEESSHAPLRKAKK